MCVSTAVIAVSPPAAAKLTARIAELEADLKERDARIVDILAEGEALSRKQSTFEEKLKALRAQLKAAQADRDARKEEVLAGERGGGGRLYVIFWAPHARSRCLPLQLRSD